MRFLLPSGLLGLTAGFLLAVPQASAQINAAPTSVTSPGFGGRAINGPPASVTSLGPRGYSPGPRFQSGGNNFHRGNGNNGNRNNGDHRHNRDNNFVGPVWYPYAYPVPYAVDGDSGDQSPDAYANDPNYNDPNYQGGPTVFDRRGSGDHSYIPPVKDAPAAHAPEQADETSSAVDVPQPTTVLVFRDGHTLEIGNYAIVGTTLFDLTLGHPRRIPLADLDLDATSKQNNERGVAFNLPPSAQGQ